MCTSTTTLSTGVHRVDETTAQQRADWRPYDECPCGCGVIGHKLKVKNGHVVGCKCRSCLGTRNRRNGQKSQSRALKDAARAEGTSMEIAPTHEEQARLLVHYESKQGEQVPKGLRGEWMRKTEQQARGFAQRQVPTRKWAVVFSMPGGGRRIWMDYEEYLALIGELKG